MSKLKGLGSLKAGMAIVVIAVILIAMILFAFSWIRGKNPETVPILICGITMLTAGFASLFVTRWARGSKRFFAVNGLMGVTTIMIVPLLFVVIIHAIAEKTAAHLVFSYIVVYYLMFLPVGTWLVLPPATPKSGNKTDDNRSQQD